MVESKNVQLVLNQLLHGRKIAMVIGNCQTEYIRKYMCQSPNFTEGYIFLKIPMIHRINQNDQSVLEKNKYIFEKCSLCITQIIAENNEFSRFLSTSNVLQLVGNKTKVIKIPVLYFDNYYPQTIHQRKTLETLKNVGIFSFLYGIVS